MEGDQSLVATIAAEESLVAILPHEDAAKHEGGLTVGVADIEIKHGEASSHPVDTQNKWETKRKYNNMQRSIKSKLNKRAKQEKARVEPAEPIDDAERKRLYDEARELRVAAHLAQQAKLNAALEGGLKLVIDCSFSVRHSIKEMRSLAKQLECSCGSNKRAAAPVALTLTSWTGQIAEIAKPMGGDGWRAHKVAESVWDTLQPGQTVVVLSPDATEPLLALDANAVYVIGGIVDRSVQKHITLKYAEEHGVLCRRLPIAEHADAMGLAKGAPRRPVLNINNVVVALLEFHATGDWVKALDLGIPGRKKRDTSGRQLTNDKPTSEDDSA